METNTTTTMWSTDEERENTRANWDTKKNEHERRWKIATKCFFVIYEKEELRGKIIKMWYHCMWFTASKRMWMECEWKYNETNM